MRPRRVCELLALLSGASTASVSGMTGLMYPPQRKRADTPIAGLMTSPTIQSGRVGYGRHRPRSADRKYHLGYSEKPAPWAWQKAGAVAQ